MFIVKYNQIKANCNLPYDSNTKNKGTMKRNIKDIFRNLIS